MNFSEKTQTFLVASYYKHLKERFGERGRNAFLHGVKHYAMQRGSRMAQRAIRAGEPLDYGAFCRYGEWVPSEEAVLSGTASVSEVTAVSPDYEYHVTACPWFLGFREADAMEAGALYCGCLDEAMLRGFHEAIEFHTVQTMHEAECCIFRVDRAGMTAETRTEKHREYVKGYDYHCAHVYYAIGEIAGAVFAGEGERVCAAVMNDFEEKYGAEMAEKLRSYKNENFNCC
ncbi:MAG TPA: L-2-amino-thiazoline-4-carboxylic acid hydrolase [Candidatus Choladousia intestinipullorum]|nr:L-2-amino-thiazoline-4-carboxylic acid hydrolase [Candidatus Choladousia intestinipullorum]